MFVILGVLVALLAIAQTASAVIAYRTILVVDEQLDQIRSTLQPVDQPLLDDLRLRLESAERAIDDLPRSWEKERRDALSAESRARHHATRALDELDARGLSSPGLDVVAYELFGKDARPSEPESVQPVHDDVEEPAIAEGWEAMTRRKKYG